MTLIERSSICLLSSSAPKKGVPLDHTDAVLLSSCTHWVLMYIEFWCALGF